MLRSAEVFAVFLRFVLPDFSIPDLQILSFF